MEQLTNTDLHFVVSRLPKDVAMVVKEHGLIVAGGYIRETISGGKVSDLDIFGTDLTALKVAALTLAQSRKGRMYETRNAITVLAPPRLPAQFIKRWLFNSPDQCVRSFDFTVCQAAIWFNKSLSLWQSSCSPFFYADLAAKRLVYAYPIRDEDAGGSMLRMRKFIQRGYSIQSQSMAGVISRLVGNLDMSKVDIGNEREVAKILTGLLREVDPLTVVDGVELIDEHALASEAVTVTNYE